MKINSNEDDVIITKINYPMKEENETNENKIEIKEEINQEFIPFNCPIGGNQIEIPVKSIYCNHSTCYCLHNYLQISLQSNIWHCPICGNQSYFSDLQFDSEFSSFLPTIPDGTFVGLLYLDNKTRKQLVTEEDAHDQIMETDKEEEHYFSHLNL